MRTLVESLTRLYAAERVSLEKLNTMVTARTITEEELAYITLGAQPNV